jgi:hypothetical protein
MLLISKKRVLENAQARRSQAEKSARACVGIRLVVLITPSKLGSILDVRE